MADPTSLPVLSNPQAYTRRKLIAGSAIGLSWLVIGNSRANAREASTASAKTNILEAKLIHQEEGFTVNPARIYELLLNDKQFAAFSGGRAAEIHREVGGPFSLFDGHIVGRILELVPNRRIVQAWRVVSWLEGDYSIARFELVAKGSGTLVILDHAGFPSELAEHLESGWNKNYWTALQTYLRLVS